MYMTAAVSFPFQCFLDLLLVPFFNLMVICWVLLFSVQPSESRKQVECSSELMEQLKGKWAKESNLMPHLCVMLS